MAMYVAKLGHRHFGTQPHVDPADPVGAWFNLPRCPSMRLNLFGWMVMVRRVTFIGMCPKETQNY